jgi:dTDP-glucose pyrophosphorylase
VRDRLERCSIPASASLRDGMVAINRGAVEIALVVDEQNRLVGTLTDGDARRALLAGAQLDEPVAPHCHRDFTAVTDNAGRAEVMDLMRARRIGQIPIVDEQGQLIGLHLLHEIIGATVRPNWAVIMAGGRGTRLRPLTDEIPKPMIRVAGRPIVERLVLHLVGFGVRTIYIAINHLGEQIEQHFGDGSRFGCRIEYLRETEPLGTGGALSLLPAVPTEPIVVMNGDLVTEADLGAMLDFHSRGAQAVTLGVRRYRHVVPFGCLELEGDRIVRMEEKPTLIRPVNAGIYVLSPKVVARVPHRPIGLPLVLESTLDAGEVIKAFEIDADWIDVGRPDQLQQARGEK